MPVSTGAALKSLSPSPLPYVCLQLSVSTCALVSESQPPCFWELTIGEQLAVIIPQKLSAWFMFDICLPSPGWACEVTGIQTLLLSHQSLPKSIGRFPGYLTLSLLNCKVGIIKDTRSKCVDLMRKYYKLFNMLSLYEAPSHIYNN